MASRGNIIVVSAPSGGGKGTILARIFEKDDRLTHAVSATTREPRQGEVEGRHYYFVTPEEFERWIDEKRFAEWAEVHGKYYGTLNSELEKILDTGHDVVLELDVQGMRSIKRGLERAVSIFIMSPSMEVLEQRLRDRGGLDEDQLALRLKNAKEEIAANKEYDCVILNDDLDHAVAAFEAILSEIREKNLKQTP